MDCIRVGFYDELQGENHDTACQACERTLKLDDIVAEVYYMMICQRCLLRTASEMLLLNLEK